MKPRTLVYFDILCMPLFQRRINLVLVIAVADQLWAEPRGGGDHGDMTT